MINFDALNTHLNNLLSQFIDSRYNTVYGEIWRTASDLKVLIRRFPEDIRTDYIESLIDDKFKELSELLDSVDLKDEDAIAESKLEDEDRLTEDSILSKAEFIALKDKAFDLKNDAGLDIFDEHVEALIEAANNRDEQRLGRVTECYIFKLLSLAETFVWNVDPAPWIIEGWEVQEAIDWKVDLLEDFIK